LFTIATSLAPIYAPTAAGMALQGLALSDHGGTLGVRPECVSGAARAIAEMR
jgi:hypothetical protein